MHYCLPFTLLLLALTTLLPAGRGQDGVFTRQDSLRGSITPQRAWWDLTYYHLDIAVDPEARRIEGRNTVQFKVLEPKQVLQLDLQYPMSISRVTWKGKALSVTREGNVWWVDFGTPLPRGAVEAVVVEYGGKPKVSARPPWDGGLTWSEDSRGNPFIATSCQGDGASLWWPCKDHMYDEPDSMLISVRVPPGLMDVSNGSLRSIDEHADGSRTFHWYVDNPINNYGVNINIADYAHFGETYAGEKGPLACDYYVLPENLERAKAQFAEVPRMLEAFEYWFGPYPFYEDGFKLVEVPYLGMEHQSSVTYGNGYQNGYLGTDLSGTGWGLKFDFIIVHEAGHEWFANNITYKDIADMWVHEGFTNYSESLFLDYHYGTEAANAYTRGVRHRIANREPVIGPYDVNTPGSSDMYYKGANMLLTLRRVVDDDQQWRQILRGLNQAFFHQTVTSAQVEAYLSQQIGLDLDGFFDQYLRDVRIPVFEYYLDGPRLYYRWQQTVDGFDLPLRVKVNGEEQVLRPAASWKVLEEVPPASTVTVDPNYYVIPWDSGSE